MLKKIFGRTGNEKVKVLLKNGATVIDVRTPNEYRTGHVQGSLNIPLGTFKERLDEIAAIQEPVIVCCRSGVRSGQALSLLRRRRDDCANGRSWKAVQSMLYD